MRSRSLERAKRRLDVAQDKVEAVRHWIHAIDHAVTEYHGSLAPLSGWLDAEVPKALSALRGMAAVLEAYVGVPQPAPAAVPPVLHVENAQDAGATPAPQPPEAAP